MHTNKNFKDNQYKLYQNCLDYQNYIFSEIKYPVIRELISREILSEKFMYSFINLFFIKRKVAKLNPINKKKVSTWGVLTKLILKGFRSVSYSTNAIRFGHIELMEGIVKYDEEFLRESLRLSFYKEKEFSFPWQTDYQDQKIINYRLNPVDFKNIDCFHLKNNTIHKIKKNTPNLKPLIIFSDEQSKLNILSERELIRYGIYSRPFVFFIKNYCSDNRDYCMVHFICNHEIMDGLPASYYLNRFMNKLHLKQTEFVNLPNEFVEKLFFEADIREHYNEKAGFKVQSYIFPESFCYGIIMLYNDISRMLANYNLLIAFEVFFPMLLFSKLAKGNHIKACTLKFLPKINEQLDFFTLKNIDKMFENLIVNPESFKDNYSDYLVKDKYVSLFGKGNNIVGKYIRPMVNKLPLFCLKAISFIANKSGASRACIGQIVITGVPNQIRLGSQLINLGGGFGGPTCAGFQDAAITIGYAKDKSGIIKKIIIRRKYKQIQIV